MPDRDEEDVPASLALPKLSLRRSRRGKAATPPEPAPGAEASAQPGPAPDFEPASESTPTTVEVEPADVQPADVQPADVQPADVQPADVQPADVQPADVQPADVAPADVEPTIELRPTEQLPQPPEPASDAPAEPQRDPEPVAEAPAAPPTEERTPREPLRLPEIGPWPVVLVTGLLVGAVLVGLTWGSLRACESIQGTATCGRTGYPLVGLILVLAVVAGALLLRVGGVPDPVSTSILGVGLTAVLVLLFLVGHLDHPASAVAVVLIDVATFAAAHGLTTRVVEPARD